MLLGVIIEILANITIFFALLRAIVDIFVYICTIIITPMIEKNKIKRWLQWAAWVVVIALLAGYYVKNGAGDESQSQDTEQAQVMMPEYDNQSTTASVNYETVLLPRGMSDRVRHVASVIATAILSATRVWLDAPTGGTTATRATTVDTWHLLAI